jgi:hypothetical protein
MPLAPGQPVREDYQYQRGGVGNLFLVCEPLAGWRQVMSATGAPAWTGRTPVKELVDVHYPDAERIVLVQDNPEHPHAGVAVCGVPAGRGQAASQSAGAALHPRHGSWLNMAELELAMLAGQCLDRRLADRATLEQEVAAWQAARNRAGRGVNWRFTTEDARIKLKHLYPTTQG